MSYHFPPRTFTVPAGILAGALLSDERTRVPQPVTLAPGRYLDVITLAPSEYRDITPTHGRDTSRAQN